MTKLIEYDDPTEHLIKDDPSSHLKYLLTQASNDQSEEQIQMTHTVNTQSLKLIKKLQYLIKNIKYPRLDQDKKYTYDEYINDIGPFYQYWLNIITCGFEETYSTEGFMIKYFINQTNKLNPYVKIIIDDNKSNVYKIQTEIGVKNILDDDTKADSYVRLTLY